MKSFFSTFSILLTSLLLTAQTYHTQQEPLPCLNKTFSIVVHIVRDTFGNLNINTTEISDRVAEMNTFFKPICVGFEICEVRIIPNFQYDNIRDQDEWDEMLDKYHQPNRINMFFVSSSFGGAQECGFATQGGIQNVETGGILVNKFGCVQAGLNMIPHLMGHYFGLLHTFEGSGRELVDGSNCQTEGDLICDTPADPLREGSSSANYLDRQNKCRFTDGAQDLNGEPYRPDVGNMMSYYFEPEECRCGFSYQQFLKMANTYVVSSPKMW